MLVTVNVKVAKVFIHSLCRKQTVYNYIFFDVYVWMRFNSDSALLQTVIATQLPSFSVCYKAANDNLCSSKQLTQSSLTLFFSSTQCLECTQVHTPRLHDCGIWEAQVGKTVIERLERMGWKEAEEGEGRYKGKKKGERRNTEIVRDEKREARMSVWCGLDGLVLMALHPVNSHYCNHLLFKNQS